MTVAHTDIVRQAKKGLFLEAFASQGTVLHAAKEVGIHRDTHYQWMKEDPDYAKAFSAASEDSVQNLEAEARRRAFAGSDTLLIFILKAARPERYRERIEMHVNMESIAASMVDGSSLSAEEVMAEADRILAGR